MRSVFFGILEFQVNKRLYMELLYQKEIYLLDLCKKNNLVLIIKNDENHDDVHYLKLSVNQISFPINFNLTNMDKITNSGPHLMTLLIFGFTHRLLWEASFSRQNLIINHVNPITFVIKDVCECYFKINHMFCLSNIQSLIYVFSKSTSMLDRRLSVLTKWYN